MPLLLQDRPETAGGNAAGPARQRRTRRGLLRLISPVVVLLLWQTVSELGLVSAQKLPPPTEVWSTAVSLVTTNSPAYGTLQDAMLVSLERVAIGFGVGAAVAVPLAVLAGLSRLGEHSVDPLMQMLRTVPLFGLIPVFIVWFGIGELPKILLSSEQAISDAFTAAGLIPVHVNFADYSVATFNATAGGSS